jgi:hypothetical protein
MAANHSQTGSRNQLVRNTDLDDFAGNDRLDNHRTLNYDDRHINYMHRENREDPHKQQRQSFAREQYKRKYSNNGLSGNGSRDYPNFFNNSESYELQGQGQSTVAGHIMRGLGSNLMTLNPPSSTSLGLGLKHQVSRDSYNKY